MCMIDFVCVNLYFICTTTHVYNRFYFMATLFYMREKNIFMTICILSIHQQQLSANLALTLLKQLLQYTHISYSYISINLRAQHVIQKLPKNRICYMVGNLYMYIVATSSIIWKLKFTHKLLPVKISSKYMQLGVWDLVLFVSSYRNNGAIGIQN